MYGAEGAATSVNVKGVTSTDAEDQRNEKIESKLIPGTSATVTVPQPEEKNRFEEGSVVSVNAKEKARSKHSMTLRSKSRSRHSVKSRDSKASSCSCRTKLTNQSSLKSLNSSQLREFYKTREDNHKRKTLLEKQHLEDRLRQEQDELERSIQEQDETLRLELKSLEEEERRKSHERHQAILQKIQERERSSRKERENINKRSQMEKEEMKKRHELEQLNLDIEQSEQLASIGCSSTPQNENQETEQTGNWTSASSKNPTSDTSQTTGIVHTVTGNQVNGSWSSQSPGDPLNPGMVLMSSSLEPEISAQPNINTAEQGLSMFANSVTISSTNTIPVVTRHDATVNDYRFVPPPKPYQVLEKMTAVPEINTAFSNPFADTIRTCNPSIAQAAPNLNPNRTSSPTTPTIICSTRAGSVTTNPIVVYSVPQTVPSFTTSTPTGHSKPENLTQLPSHDQRSPVIVFSNLPPSEPPMFDGNSSDFREFEDLFNTVICRKVNDQKERLVYLLQYTTGAAHAIVKGCLHKGARCCDEAMKLLKEHFGQSFQVGQASINALTSNPQYKVTDREDLIIFSAKIMSCANTLTDINYGNVPVITIDEIATKMPYAWRSGWLSKVDDVVNEQHQSLTLNHLASYLRKRIREISNVPSRESAQFSKRNPIQFNGPKINKSLFATAVVECGDKVCSKCRAKHYLNQCPIFRNEMNYQERRDFVFKLKLCFACLKAGHRARECNRENPCKVPECNGKHTTLLHPPPNLPNKPKTSTNPLDKYLSESGKQIDDQVKIKESTFMSVNRPSEFLHVMPVKLRVKGSNKIISTQCFLDSGSTCSFLNKSVIKLMNLSGHKAEMSIRTILETEKRWCSVIKNVEISDYEESEFHPLNTLFSSDKIDVDKTNIPTQRDISMFPEFKEIAIPKLDSDVGILIGQDHANLFKPLRVVDGPHGYYAVQTCLGWIISCPSVRKLPEKGRQNTFNTQHKIKNSQLCEMCSDIVNANLNEKREMSANEVKFLEIMKTSMKLSDDNHYELDLPLKDPGIILPLNERQAYNRVQSLRKKFTRERSYYLEYKAFMEDMILSGYAERVDDQMGPIGKTWYLSHHGVRHPRKDTLRVVHDCSAKFHNVSLNDVLLQGPDLSNNLVGVLCRFRKERIAIQGDIKSMFLQVRVSKHHRDLLRFLWWENGDISKQLKTYRMTVFMFGTVCSPSCAGLALKQTAIDKSQKFNERTLQSVRESFYVDDFLDSYPNAVTASTQLKDVTKLVAKGGFELTKWVSNNRNVIMSVPEAKRAKELIGLDLESTELPVEKVLGLIWNVEQDTLCFRVQHKDKPMTRRGMLSITNSIYDPTGMGQPILQPVKVLMQTLCRMKLGWDDPIPQIYASAWTKWLEDLPKVQEFNIPRCFKPPEFGSVVNIQLHHFSDASEKAYGAVSYIRLTNSAGRIHCSILSGKTRLVPLNGSTIPRLELSAASISVASDRFLRKELNLPIDNSYFWTDSATVLRYLANTDKVFKTFVQNRINAIKESSEAEQWHFVPSQLNPADLPSRGLNVESFLKCKVWSQGPDFLWLHEDKWPKSPVIVVHDRDLETKRMFKNCFASSISNEDPSIIDRLTERNSSWTNLNRSVAWLLRLKRILKNKAVLSTKANSTTSQDNEKKPLSVDELKKAELEIIKHEQMKYYRNEILELQKAKPKPESNRAKKDQVTRSSSLYKLNPFLSNGLLRVGGRIGAAYLNHNAKFPLIVPKESSIVPLLIEYTHQRVGHSGREYTIAELRQKFWIINVNTLVRHIINKCVSCRKRQRKPETQMMSDLPHDRLMSNKPPFSCVSVDCFGHFLIRQGRSDLKRYGVLFTCLTTRAVHVEIANTLNTDSFIMALRRFIARRGQVVEIRSDNGGNFLSAENNYDKQLKHGIRNKFTSF